MKTSELYRFTGLCLSLDEYPENVVQIKEGFLSGRVDTDDFIFLCSNHLVLPAIWLRLKKYGLIQLLPEDFRRQLEYIYTLNTNRNLEIIRQIDEISTQLDKENINPVFLKGTALLLDNIYPDAGERMIGDIDFLVQENDFLKTAELVMDLGYKHSGKVYDAPSTLKNFPRLFRKDVPADIEIHRIPVEKKYINRFSTPLLFQNKVKIKNKINCYVPASEHKLIHTFIHGHLNNNGHRHKTIAFRDVQDFYQLKKFTDIQNVIAKVQHKRKFCEFVNTIYFLAAPNNESRQNIHKKNGLHLKAFIYLLDHPGVHKQYIRICRIFDLVFTRYLLRLFSALFNKSSFRYVKNRLKDRTWYKAHLKGIKRSLFK